MKQDLYYIEEKGFPHYKSKLLADCGSIRHLYTTRLGGVSRGDQSSLNLSYRMEPEHPENVLENFRRVSGYLGCSPEDMVGADQTHTARVIRVSRKEGGNAVTCPSRIRNFDGMVTKDPGILLFITTADCVPVLLCDPLKGAVGAVHSGWKGTLGGIAGNAVRMMTEEFGSNPKDILASIGPSICVSCYEVTEDLYEAFSQSALYQDAYLLCNRPWEDADPEKEEAIFYRKENGRFQLDLWQANRHVLLSAGLLPEHTAIGGLCTYEDPEHFFSHRKSGGKRGGLGAMIGLDSQITL